MDLWIVFDLITGIANLVAFKMINSASPANLIDQTEKRNLDYYMNVIVVMSWIRYFTYFLVINSIAKATLTLARMI